MRFLYLTNAKGKEMLLAAEQIIAITEDCDPVVDGADAACRIHTQGGVFVVRESASLILAKLPAE